MLFNRKRYWPWILFAVLIFSAMTLSVVSAFPPNSSPWLTIKGTGDDTEAGQYYATIAAPATLSAWKTAYGFTGTNDTSAIYYNGGDLGFGREMHCRKNGLDVACYVVNHGLGAAAPADLSVNAAIANQNTLPVVAMVYKNALNGQPNDVSFYIYDQTGARVNKVALDSEGDKYVPYLCLPCHGGDYDSFTDSVSNANFLPFDVASFKYSQQAGYTLADQQEKFRQLNSMVRDTNPTALITELINGWYGAPNGVNTPGATPNTSFVPPGYVSDPGLYNNVVKLYCRSCHIAQSINLAAPADVSSAGYVVFHTFDMPHAELTSHNFWSGPGPAYLAKDRGWSYRVTRLDDPPPNGCNPGDCSLREAIIAGNANPDPNIFKALITFDVDGTFTLTRSGTDDTADAGDLDITSSEFILLGNGASKTIIDGGGVDRVFSILNGEIVVIQGVTIQNGNAGSAPGNLGGGILNDGSQLTLNLSVVKNNSSNQGAGVANLNNGITVINNSTIGPNNAAVDTGGGVGNSGGTVTLNNSTVSGNTAQSGAGIYTNNSGIVTNLNQSTVTGNSASVSGGGVQILNGATFSPGNSIIAGNNGPSSKDCDGTYTSQGYNLVGQNGSANGCPATGTDIVLAGSINTVLNLSLSAVGADGTPHHALVQGGPAVDAIPPGSNCTLPSYDQRNQARPLDGNVTGVAACDIGAYEFNPQSLIFLPLVVKGP